MSDEKRDEAVTEAEPLHPLDMEDRDLAAILPINRAAAFRRGYAMGSSEAKARVRNALLTLAAALEREIDEEASAVTGEAPPPIH